MIRRTSQQSVLISKPCNPARGLRNCTMSHDTPFCPKCGHKMERIFRTNSETPRIFLCRECGHEQRRYGEPWSWKDIQFGIFTELLKIRVLLEKAIPDSSPQTSAQPLSSSLSEGLGNAAQKAAEPSQSPEPHHSDRARRRRSLRRAAKQRG